MTKSIKRSKLIIKLGKQMNANPSGLSPALRYLFEQI